MLQDYLGPEIISHFVMHGAGISEIVKSLITVLKKKDDISGIFLESLKRVEFSTSIIVVQFSQWCHISCANLQFLSFLLYGVNFIRSFCKIFICKLLFYFSSQLYAQTYVPNGSGYLNMVDYEP